MQVLQESALTILHNDNLYRRQDRYIIIATIGSLIPIGYPIDPNIYGGAIGDYTWDRVQYFFSQYVTARKKQMPMHYYTELMINDYVEFVGLPLTNRSWFLQEAAVAGVLPIDYRDAILIVVQENFAVENTDKRLWKVLAHTLITPLMRMMDITRQRILFFEQLANRKALQTENWAYRFQEPVFLDPLQLDLALKEYEKR